MSAALVDEAAALTAGLRQTGAAPAALAGMLAGAVRAQPDHAAARIALAQNLWTAGDRTGAVAQYREAAARRPKDPGAAALLGIALVRRDLHAHGPGLAAGRDVLAQVAEQAPEIVDARLWLGIARLELRATDDALATFDALLPLLPQEANLHMARGHALLRLGRLAEGWAEYAWRWRRDRKLALRAPADPLARPDPTAWRGRVVLLYAEQGHGDTLQCLRYLDCVQRQGARVVLEVQPALARLAAALPGVAVVAAGAAVPVHDVAVPLFHLPWAFGSVPAEVPYVHPVPAEVARWRHRLAALPGLRVGLVWAGEPGAEGSDTRLIDRRRSLPLTALAPLAAVPGVSLVALQKGEAAAQTPPPGMLLHDWAGELADFADTAALMAGLDLVITVDTAAAHLAGALGRDTWLLNRFDADWRWLAGRDDSLWYPTLRQFRQEAPGDWAGVVARVAAALAVRAGGR